MMRTPLTLLAAAFFLVSALWRQRTAGTGALGVDLAVSSLVVWAVAMAWVGGATVVTKDRDRQLLIGMFGIAWTMLYGSFAVSTATSGPWTALVWTGIWVALGTAVVVARGSLEAFGRALVGASAMATLFGIWPLLRPLAPATPGIPAWHDGRHPAVPDIYLIVLDKYTSGAWLKSSYGFDHADFEDSLRTLGYAVPTAARTNYAHTKLVLASLLRGALLPHDSLGVGRAAYDALTDRIMDAPLWAEARERGYRIVFFPSTFEGTRRLPAADLVLRMPRARRGGWAETFWSHTPLAMARGIRCVVADCRPATTVATPYPVETIEEIEWKLAQLMTLPDSAGPIFGFLHLLVPHEPYLFDAACAAREPWWPLSDQPPTDPDSLRAAYATQVRCLDRLLLPVLTHLARRQPAPVVIVTGDHGNGLLAVDVLRGITLEHEDLTEAQLGERFGVFTAMHAPGATGLVPEDVSLVELLPLMRHAAWGELKPMREDRVFWSSYQRALELTPVAAALARPPSTP